MKTEQIIKIEGFLSIAGAIGLIIWWFLMPLFLPVAESANNFQLMVLDKNWIPLNIVGLISALLISLGFPGFYLKEFKKINKIGFVGLIVALTGLILFVSIQYYETLIWPAAVQVTPELLQVKGALVSGNTNVVAGLIVSGVFLGIGYILFGSSALKTKAFPKIPVWFLIIGAPVFGNGVLFPIRTIGLILFCTGTIWLANFIRH